MVNNKRVLGATKKFYNNIQFKSMLEVSCYKVLQHSGLAFTYEEDTLLLWEGIKLDKTLLYAPNKIGNGRYSKNLLQQNRKLVSITYTPDFTVIKNNYKIYIDCKGKENDTYPIKKKMFLKKLENLNDGYNYIFFEPHSVSQMKEAVYLIQQL